MNNHTGNTTNNQLNQNNKPASLPEYIENICRHNKGNNALTDRYSNILLTFDEFNQEISKIAAGLQKLGLQKGDKVTLLSENNARWFVFDQAILRCGAVDAVRGAKAPVAEIQYIIKHSDSTGVVVYDMGLFEKLKATFDEIHPKFVIIMFTKNIIKQTCDYPVFSYDEFVEFSKDADFLPPDIQPQDEATIIYTSGTTSMPKGVMLTHSNLISQVELLHPFLDAKNGGTYLCLLPVWHAYERSVEYYFFAHGTSLIYTNIKNIKSDLAKYKADYITAVPRIWESLANNIQNTVKNKSKLLSDIFAKCVAISSINKKALRYLKRSDVYVRDYTFTKTVLKSIIYIITLPLHYLFDRCFYAKAVEQMGIGAKICISGGGALAPVYADFFEAIGVNLVVGYGLTETSPVIALNSVKIPNVLYTAGKPLNKTDIKVVNPQTFEEVPRYEKGVVLAKGPQIMKGYYKNETATREIILDGGWLNTGDIGWMSNQRDLVLTGRQKEIIVLSNGENIEPEPIEQVCLMNENIAQIMLVGQDKATLGALIIPSAVAYSKFCDDNNISPEKKCEICQNLQFIEFMKNEVSAQLKTKNHFRSFERICKIALLSEEFSVANGLMTMTSKIKRNVVADKYSELIEKMYNNK